MSAKEHIKEVLTIFPDDKKALEMLRIIEKKEMENYLDVAYNYIKIKDYENAKKELEKIIKKYTNCKQAYYELGNINYEQGNKKQALEYFRMALKIDNNYIEAKDMEEKILKEAEKEKPVWLEEGYFYKEARLVFEDFEDETIISKFIADSGKFERVVEGDKKYGRWEVEIGESDIILSTAIRLPDLSKFDGLIVSLMSENITIIDLILVEQQLNLERRWKVPISGIENKWKEIKVPFRYFICEKEPTAKIDLAKITEIKFLISPAKYKGIKKGYLGIDKLIFYK